MNASQDAIALAIFMRKNRKEITMSETQDCIIHSLGGKIASATILRKIGDNQYEAEYNGIRCTAIFNFFTGYYYVDDVYGIIK